MTNIAILYASSEGQTAKVSRYIKELLTKKGFKAEVYNLNDLPKKFSITGYKGIIVGASVHIGSHQKYGIEYVKDNIESLNEVKSAFFSICLAKINNSEKTIGRGEKQLQRFLKKTGWKPDKTAVFSGALKYSKYGFMKKVLMKFISKLMGEETDTSKDYEYTEWNKVEKFVNEFMSEIS